MDLQVKLVCHQQSCCTDKLPFNISASLKTFNQNESFMIRSDNQVLVILLYRNTCWDTLYFVQQFINNEIITYPLPSCNPTVIWTHH